MSALTDKVVAVAKREPVAVWGVVLAAVLGLLPVLGVPAGVVAGLTVVLPLIGVPVVRRRVSPVELVEALVDGADGKVDGTFKVGK